jgi:TRAP-type mannitol/chloroaromatic compound transport system permease small subunit
MRVIVGLIDSISEYVGKIARWACVALIAVMVYEVVARYVFNEPTQWAFETATMLGATIAIFGWVYTHRHYGHVRIDVIYSHLTYKGKAIIDVIFCLLLCFPMLLALTYTAGERMWFSFSMSELLTQGYWYPPASPIRTVVFLGLSLFTLQSVAHFIRDLYLLIRNEPL